MVLLATSCAALSSPSSSTHGGRTPSSINRGFYQQASTGSTTALRYRSSGDSQSVDRQDVYDRAVAHLNQDKTSATFRRNYRAPQIRVPAPVPSPTVGPQDEQQLVMDEYLEYVEKRYNRVHSRDAEATPLTSQGSSRNAVFSPWAWLSDTSSVTRASITSGSSTDPLYILGLSKLASAQLLQKHQVPARSKHDFSFPALSVESVLFFVVPESPLRAALVDSASITDSVAKSGGRVASFVGVSFLGQLKLMTKTLQRLWSSFTTTVKILSGFVSRTFSGVLKNGGFRRSAHAFSVASIAALFVLRPVFRAAMKNTTFQG